MTNIRQMTRADRAIWCAMRQALWPCDGDDHETETAGYFDEPHACPQVAFIAEIDGQPAGFAEVAIRPVAEGCDSRNVGYLEGWYVDANHRNTGIGRALVAAGEQWAREQGCSEFASDTGPDNTVSHRAHLACGFEDVGLVQCFAKKL